MLNPDFRDMLSACSDEGVEYLLVGAYALATYGLPRATGDIDLWIRPEPENAARVMRTLGRFGAPLHGLEANDLLADDLVFQIGVAPFRIDLLTTVDGVAFEEAWREREEVVIDGLRVPVISRRHLIQNKRAVGRLKDEADARWLEGERE